MALNNENLRLSFENIQRRIKHEARIEIDRLFLKLTKLKVGSPVRCIFQLDNGNKTYLKELDGVIIQDENYYLKVQSLEQQPYGFGFSKCFKYAEINDIVSF